MRHSLPRFGSTGLGFRGVLSYLLKKAIGATVVEPSLLEDLLRVDPPYLPELILDHRSVMRDSVSVAQVLVKWFGLLADEATWVDEEDMRCQFPFFSLVHFSLFPLGRQLIAIILGRFTHVDHDRWRIIISSQISKN
ncbi:hypothetical protein SASPL_143827 [Salvia splendens]|uniref:Chromo domain-containing protein n=1 Tax=Salvia splendens TaxID=180675 RepID=A0A8X8WMJ2_SALSN|nr:hypothetical protein SASPL_143827 [Salvia splendens]